ncbi:MAG: metallophosphoesterase [Solirubrobacterales bacterium]
MRTAIVSDLHLGLASGGDVLRDPDVRALLLEEVAGAEQLVLLGDVVELRELALGPALERARPFFEELGEALGERPVVLVPGNHDHRFAEPLLERLSLQGEALGLEQRHGPAEGATAAIDEWLGPAGLEIGYPGIWLRDDVYATHGHYMDCHLRLPRFECIAVAALARLGEPPPEQAAPADYERVFRPLYGFGFGFAQVRPAPVTRTQANSAEVAWEVLAGQVEARRRSGQLAMAGARAAFPAAIWAVNRLLRSDFESDISGRAIFQAGLDGAAEMSRRLGIDDVHVITGHSHRAGPLAEEGEWPLAGGGSLHNTGSWVFASAFHHPGRPPSPYWPGTLTWVEDEGPPRRVELLREHSHATLTELLERAADYDS